MTFTEYSRLMKAQDPLITNMFDMGDGTCLIVKRLMFHWTLLRGAIGDLEGYDDRWCYDSQETALYGVSQWAIAKFEGEPIGWHRHHATGRRRPGGDPAQEYIAH